MPWPRPSQATCLLLGLDWIAAFIQSIGLAPFMPRPPPASSLVGCRTITYAVVLAQPPVAAALAWLAIMVVLFWLPSPTTTLAAADAGGQRAICVKVAAAVVFDVVCLAQAAAAALLLRSGMAWPHLRHNLFVGGRRSKTSQERPLQCVTTTAVE